MRMLKTAIPTALTIIIAISAFAPSTTFAREVIRPSVLPTHPNSVNVNINMLSFNPVIGDIDTRLDLRFPEHLITKTYSPKFDTYLIDLFSVGDSVFKISAQKKFSIFDAVMTTTYQVDDAGRQFLYPFDVHHAKITFFAEASEPNAQPENSVLKRLPINYDCGLCSFEGYDVKVSHAKNFASDLVSLDVNIHRSTSIIVFSLAITLGMWVIGGTVLILAMRIVKSKEVPEMGVLGFTGGLLFALPAVRSIQPMAPPMGVLIDYLGFFWAELAIIISLIIVVVCWIERSE